MGCGCDSGSGGCSCLGNGGGVPSPRGERIIEFFPRPTTLIATQAGTLYYSDPADVTEYKTLTIEVVELASLGDGVLLETWIETGFDLANWATLGANFNPPSVGSIVAVRTDPARHVRHVVKATSVAAAGLVVMWSRAVARRQ